MNPSVMCDNSKCDWEQEITKEQMIDWVGTPCPKCGYTPIVTREEYQLWKVATDFVDSLPPVEEDEEVVKVSVGCVMGREDHEDTLTVTIDE